MTYAGAASQYGKHAVQIVELYLDACTLTYSVAPCMASITGVRCFNTRSTCKDTANYTRGTKVYRFSTVRIDGIQAPGDSPTFPVVLSLETSPTVLTPGKGLGVRSTVSISLADFPWTDSGIDPYLAQRLTASSAVTYDSLSAFYDDMVAIYDDLAITPTYPDNIGSFWGKFLKRNRFYQNRRLDVLTGFLDENGLYDSANFKRRTYIITNIAGPNPDGRIVIEGSDPLKFADGEKAKFPQASTSKLNGAIDPSVTTISVLDPDDILTAWYGATPTQRYLRIDEEIIHVDSASGLGSGTVSISIDRATMPSQYDSSKNIPAAHNDAATVQICWEFDNAMVYDIVYYLLFNVASMPSAYLPYSTWKEGIDANFPDLSFSTLLTDPIAVKDLLTEITELSVLLWWHERDQVVYLKGLRFEQTHEAQIEDQDNIIGDTLSVTEDQKSLATQFWTFYDITWPLANPKLLSSFRIVDVRADLEKESADEYGLPSIREVRSRWLNGSDSGIVSEVGGTMIRQYSDVRKVITFNLDPKDDNYWVGDTVGISTKYVQDEDGNAVAKNYLITQSVETFNGAGVQINHTATELFSFVNIGNIAPNDVSQPYSSALQDDKNKYAYICYNSIGGNPPVFLDGSPAYQIS